MPPFRKIVCIKTTQPMLIAAYPRTFDKHAKRDASVCAQPSIAAIARYVCEQYGRLLTPEDPEDRPRAYMESRVRLICDNPNFLKPFRAASMPTPNKRQRKLGSDLQESLLLESVKEKLVITFLNIKKHSANVQTFEVLGPLHDVKTMSEVCVCDFFRVCVCILCVFF